MDEKVVFPEHAWPLFRKALEHIAAHPDEFYMAAWVVPPDVADGEFRARFEDKTGYQYPACGTVACLAGRVCLEAGVDPKREFVTGTLALERLAVDSPLVRGTLRDIFGMIDIRSYPELREALESRFTFPEPLPEPVA